MSSDTSNSGIMQKADQIAFHFYTKLFYTVNQARATEEAHSQGKIDKWFNLETPDSDLFTREAREPYRNISLSPPPGPPPLEIQVLLCIPELTNNQVLIHRSDDLSNTTDPSAQRSSSSSSSGSPSPARPTSPPLRIEPTPRSIVLETWNLTFVPHGNSSRLGDQALPTIYKHGIPLFRSLYSLLRVLPVWKLSRRLKRRTGGLNRNGLLGISLRVRPLEENDEGSSALGILAFGTPPSPSHPPLQTQTHTFSPLPHPLGSLTLSATYLSSPNFELDELESHLSSRFISLDLQGFVPTLSKHTVREEREDSSGGGGGSVGTGIGGTRSPPRAIVGATGGGRGGHGHSHGLGLGLGLGTGLGPPNTGESSSSVSSVGRPVTTADTTDNMSVAERFIIPSRVSSLSLAAAVTTSSSSSSALIPPPRPQFTPLPVPLPFPTAGGATSSSSSGASGLALHRIRRESSNSPSSIAAAVTGPGTGVGTGGGGSPSSEIFSSSISPHRSSPHTHSPLPYPSYPSSSLSSSPMSGVGIGAVPIRRQGAGSVSGINPFKGNTLSSASASASASGSSPSLSIRQGLSSGVTGGGGGSGGSPLSTGFPGSVGSSTRIGFPPPTPSIGYGATPSLGDRRGRMSSESDRGDWDGDDRRDRSVGEGSRERDRYRRISSGYSMGFGLVGTPSERQEDAAVTGGGGGGGVGVPTRIQPTRKRYSSSFGNRYVGSVGSGGSGVGSGTGGESGGSMPASVGAASTGAAAEGTGGTEGGAEAGNGKGKEQGAAGGVASFLSTATDDDDISIFVQDIDARKPLSGRVKEREKRERDREREEVIERGRERDREEEGQDHDREMSVRSKGKQKEREMVTTSPVSRQRQRSPLSPLSAADREARKQQMEKALFSSSPPLATGTTLPSLVTTERITSKTSTLESATATVPETTTTVQPPSLLSTSPPALPQLSTSPNRGPMLTNQGEIEERLKRMNETFMRSLEGMGRGGGGGGTRRRDKEKGKEKETERDSTRRGLSLLVSPGEGEVTSPTSGSGGPFVHTTNPGQIDEQYPIPSSIPVHSSSPGSSTGAGSGSSSNQATGGAALHPHTGLGLGLGGGGRGSTSTSTSASSEAIASASQGSEEVIGRMDFYDESVLGMGRRFRSRRF